MAWMSMMSQNIPPTIKIIPKMSRDHSPALNQDFAVFTISAQSTFSPFTVQLDVILLLVTHSLTEFIFVFVGTIVKDKMLLTGGLYKRSSVI